MELRPEDISALDARAELLDGTVLRSISGFYEVQTALGQRTAALRAGLRRQGDERLVASRGRVRSRGSVLEPVVVGDRVRLRIDPRGNRDWIEEVLPRERELARRAA